MPKHLLKIILILFWIGIFILAFYWYGQSGLTLKELPNFIRQVITAYGQFNAALLFIGYYTISALLFFPPSQILNLAAGLIFGPLYGIIFSFIGLNLNANFAFIIGRFLGRDFIKSHEHHNLLEKIDHQLKNYGFITTLVLRLMYLPFDAVNFVCGMSAMRHLDFAFGTAIGIIPNILTFNLLGSSFSNPLYLALSGGTFIVGLSIAIGLKKTRNSKVTNSSNFLFPP